VAAFTENFSPIPRIAPPPLGRETDGTDACVVPASGGPAACRPLLVVASGI
jgi:hypothetical protein